MIRIFLFEPNVHVQCACSELKPILVVILKILVVLNVTRRLPNFVRHPISPFQDCWEQSWLNFRFPSPSRKHCCRHELQIKSGSSQALYSRIEIHSMIDQTAHRCLSCCKDFHGTLLPPVHMSFLFYLRCKCIWKNHRCWSMCRCKSKGLKRDIYLINKTA